jgi:hypothetical protein
MKSLKLRRNFDWSLRNIVSRLLIHQKSRALATLSEPKQAARGALTSRLFVLNTFVAFAFAYAFIQHEN